MYSLFMARPFGSFLTVEDRARRFRCMTRRNNNGCLDWMGHRFKSGYGVCVWKNKHMRAHRVSYSLFVGDIPGGGQVLHTCDRPCCVEPTHLFIGNPRINQLDCISKGRQNREKGSHRYNAKLNEHKVRHIKLLFFEGTSMKELARIFSVSQWTIENIIRGKRWKHVI